MLYSIISCRIISHCREQYISIFHDCSVYAFVRPSIPQTVPARDSQDPPSDKVEESSPELEESEPHEDPVGFRGNSSGAIRCCSFAWPFSSGYPAVAIGLDAKGAIRFRV